MKAGETTIRQVLEGTKQFVVPLFQRAYSWKRKNWEILWIDIIALYEEEDGESTHFLGSIVTAPIGSRPEEVTRYLLIDGQQRLTTLMVLMAVIRDLDESDERKLAREITESYLTNRFHEEDDHRKLLPTQVDRQNFAEIMDGPIRRGVTGIPGAYRFFMRSIADQKDKSGEAVDLRLLFSRIVSSLTTVSITLGLDDNPHVIFESLNAKGAPLTAADLIRNYIFMRIRDPKEQDKLYDKQWLPMQRRLGDERNLTAYMRVLVMRTGVSVGRDDTYAKLQRYLDREGAGTTAEELISMDQLSVIYDRMSHSDHEADQTLATRFERLQRLEVTTSFPLVLRLYEQYQVYKSISTDQFILCLDAIDSFMVRRAFCLYSTRPLSKLFINICRDLDSNDLINSTMRLMIAGGWPSDETFKHHFYITPIYMFDRNKTRYALERLERSFDHKEQPTLTSTTIEHIFPQNPHEKWKDKLGEYDYKELEQCLHRIGNLSLTAYNPTLQNRYFTEKRQIYEQSNLQLNKYLAGREKWDAEEIKVRSEMLFARARQLWKDPATFVEES